MATYYWCLDCEAEMAFEMPPCEDGHEEDCVDLACVDCGFAISTGHLVASDEVVLLVA